jgi:hypothetical protein
MKYLNQIDKYLEDSDLEVNVKKTKIVIFQKEGLLKKSQNWIQYRAYRLIVSELYYLMMTSDNNGIWGVQKKRTVLQGNQTLIAVDRCWVQAPHINVIML